jgi:hypothetical protein
MSDCTPNRIFLAMPCGDSRMWAQTVMGLIAVLSVSEGRIKPFWLCGNSNIASARNEIVHHFLHFTDCDTLFWLDSDIVFSPQDFAYMLEGPEQIVIAPYARKIMGREPVGFGMGFCRVHRSVYDALNDMTDAEGGEALGRYYVEGKGVATHFHYTGASTDARWFGEDTGFWHFAALNGATVRYETRTNLGHIGSYVFGCPDQVPAGTVPYSGPGPYPRMPSAAAMQPDEPEDLASSDVSGVGF